MSVHRVSTSGPIRPSALPIRHAADALRIVGAMLSDPPREELACLLLDEERRGDVTFLVSDTPDEAILDVTSLILGVAAGAGVSGVVLASHRPGRGHLPQSADCERCAMLIDTLADAGVALVDWFIVDRGLAASVPELSGRPSAWIPAKH
ncbi:MAG TPA: JAB domain-containing protein [Acidimicrobiales bacterium]